MLSLLSGHSPLARILAEFGFFYESLDDPGQNWALCGSLQSA
jgi:hypothetical protein